VKARWQAVSAKFGALQQREKLLVAAAAIFVVSMGGYTVGVEPAQVRARALKTQLTQQKTEIQALKSQTAALESQVRDPDAANRAALAEVGRKIAAADRALREYDSKLVPPERVPQLLQSLFVRHRGLQLLSLQTLPPTPLLAPPKTDGKPPAGAEAKDGNIHRHGIEIRLAGNYLDLLAYVAELERLPQKLLWGRMSLATSAWPQSELTLTVYTLSLDPTWMVV
jgi:MSHA biogenesis protein MshJ